MNSIVYVGMDVHKESYTLCCYCYDTDKVEYKQTIPSDYKLILKYTYWQTNLAMHMGRTRYMKCPECGKRSWQKKVLTKEE